MLTHSTGPCCVTYIQYYRADLVLPLFGICPLKSFPLHHYVAKDRIGRFALLQREQSQFSTSDAQDRRTSNTTDDRSYFLPCFHLRRRRVRVAYTLCVNNQAVEIALWPYPDACGFSSPPLPPPQGLPLSE